MDQEEREFLILSPDDWVEFGAAIDQQKEKQIEKIAAKAEPVNKSELNVHPAQASILWNNKVYVKGVEAPKIEPEKVESEDADANV